ncbi:hypothetical protein AWV79_15860 [Cupriavidus sp. UYMMa02A]|nr:hypothetical protein AWV79_15860 [Cupriavidus sp. UYMMa02A]
MCRLLGLGVLALRRCSRAGARGGLGEGGMRAGVGKDCHRLRVTGKIAAHAQGIGDLRDEADVGQRGLRAEAPRPFPIPGKKALDAGHAFVDPVAIPRVLLLGRHLQLALQVLEDAQVVHRVHVAAHQIRQFEHPRAEFAARRQQARLWMARVEVVQDRQRLPEREVAID